MYFIFDRIFYDFNDIYFFFFLENFLNSSSRFKNFNFNFSYNKIQHPNSHDRFLWLWFDTRVTKVCPLKPEIACEHSRRRRHEWNRLMVASFLIVSWNFYGCVLLFKETCPTLVSTCLVSYILTEKKISFKRLSFIYIYIYNNLTIHLIIQINFIRKEKENQEPSRNIQTPSNSNLKKRIVFTAEIHEEKGIIIKIK